LNRIVIGFVLCVFFAFSCPANIEGDIESEILEASTADRWVEMSFDIDELGQTTNIKVLKSTHKGLLDKAAIRTVKKWKYKPKIVDGVAVVQKDLK
jgi:TonB family protein